jgi:hypothetical protein
MDDTTWFAESKEQLQRINEITDSFAQYTNLTINPDKAYLITLNTAGQNSVSWGTHNIQSYSKTTPIRILGIWFTASGNKKHQKELIQQKVNHTCKMLKFKRITDKQFVYIINQVLMPAIEYLTQDIVLSKNACNKINSTIASTFKHKLHLPSTAINSGTYMQNGYRLFHIYDRQLATHTKKFLQHINSEGTVGFTTQCRLQQLQNFT